MLGKLLQKLRANYSAVQFYEETGEFEYLSNFYLTKITLGCKTYSSSEHLFQSLKFKEEEYSEKVWLAPTCEECTILGRSWASPLRSDWTEEVKDQIMYEI